MNGKLEIGLHLANISGSSLGFLMIDLTQLLLKAEGKMPDDKEAAEDFGGPRKEFFRVALSEIKKKYFDKGIREHLSKDCFMVGLIMGKAPCISLIFLCKLTICHCVLHSSGLFPE